MFQQQLNEIYKQCKNCNLCECLCKTRHNVVVGDGMPNDKIMLIGEAPGEEEDLQGLPFVGRSGKLLDLILESVGFSRKENIYICNVIKCRPPQNRNPLPHEQNNCRKFLDKQLEILKPKIILLCGAVATNAILNNNKVGITKIRGKWFNGIYNSKMMPIFHPSYLLRNPSKEIGSPKWLMYQDMKEIKREYDKL